MQHLTTITLTLNSPATMNRSFRYAPLRLSTSVLFLGTCLFLTTLWVRSYWQRDSLVAHLPGMSSASINSDAGEMRIAIVPLPLDWSLESTESSRFKAIAQSSTPGPIKSVLPWSPMITFPHWYLAFVSVVLAGLPWIRWRTLFRTRCRSNERESHYYGNLQNAT